MHDDAGLALVVADVSGKGASAAILASTLQGMLYAQLAAGLPLTTIARGVNAYLCATDTGKYATLVIIRFTPAGHLEYINCGHLRPLLIRPAKPYTQTGNQASIEELSKTNIPVGLLPDTHFHSGEITLHPGDTLLLASDGITEAEDVHGKFFGPDRLFEICQRTRGDLLPILTSLEELCGSTPATDDRTLVSVSYRPGAS